MTEAFDGWFDSNFLDPDGGASHLPDWFRGDMQKAWDAGRAAQAPVGPGPIERMVTAAMDTARLEAIEECAKIAESNRHSSVMPGHVGKNIAGEIRALSVSSAECK